MKLTCPKCKNVWEEALQPGVKTHIQCSKCKTPFVTMMKSKAAPTVMKNPPRAKPAVASPEITQNYVSLLKLAHHNQMLSQETIDALLQKKDSITTFRDIFEVVVNPGHMNPAEFDAFRVLLENKRILELLLIIDLQQKKGPVIIGNQATYQPSPVQDSSQTLLDMDDSGFDLGSVTMQDDDDFEDLPNAIAAKIAARQDDGATKVAEKMTWQDNDDDSYDGGRTLSDDEDSFPEVPTSVFKAIQEEQEEQNKKDPKKGTQRINFENKFQQDEIITMVESTDFDDLKEEVESLETSIPGSPEEERQDTFVQKTPNEMKTELERVVAPKEKGAALLALLKRRNAVQLFHHYEIEREIARNNTSILFFVEQFTDPYCLKVFFYDDENFKEQKLKKVKGILKVIQNLQHANVVDIIDVDTFNQVPYVLMERNLSPSIDKQVDFTPQKLFEWMQIAAQILSAVHKKGVIHGNLKPRNILIDKNGRIYLTDFGLFGGMTADFTTIEKISPYALAYIPPELLQGKAVETISPAIDIYSMGIILYELLAGEAPFKGDTQAKITYNKMNKEPKSLTELIRLDPNYNQFINNCIATDPNHRYETLEAFMGDLDKVLRNKHIKPVKKGFFGLF